MARRGRRPIPRPEWLTPEVAASHSQRELAERAGVSVSTARRWVLELGVHKRRGRPRLSREEWIDGVESRHPGLLAQLGVRSDTAIARDFGMTSRSVWLIRKRFGVERASARIPPPEDLTRLFRYGCRTVDVARHYGVGQGVAIRWLRESGVTTISMMEPRERLEFKRPGMAAQLGRRPDTRIAKDFGISTTSVMMWRKQLGIPAFAGSDMTDTLGRLRARLNEQSTTLSDLESRLDAAIASGNRRETGRLSRIVAAAARNLARTLEAMAEARDSDPLCPHNIRERCSHKRRPSDDILAV